jgi:hypothetical protein
MMVGAALALTATHSVAGQYKIKISGVTYTNALPNIIVPFKFTNKEIIGLVTATKGAQLLYDTSGESGGTNLIVVADACGNVLSPIGLLILNSSDAVCTPQVTNGALTEQACSIPISFLGAEGTAVVDFKTLISSKGTNVLATASGVFAGPTGPGTFTISLAGAFKKPTKGCP